ncbi:MAG: hypothetical protein WC534_02175 [Candidatus Paceibacterota bacterium]
MKYFSTKGFSLIEAILSVTLLGMIAVSLGSILIYSQQGSRLSGDRSQASFLAEQGLEAIRNIRDNDFSTLSSGTYGLTTTGNQWALSPTYPEIIDIFSREIEISDLGLDRKMIKVKVGWTDNGNYREVEEITYLTNWMKLGIVIGDWTSPSIESSVAYSGGGAAIDVETEGNYAYIIRTLASPYFAITDISDPANPITMGSCPNANCSLNTSLQKMTVFGNYAYVTSTNSDQELQIIDISDKSNPVKVGFYNTPGTSDGNGLWYKDGLIYLTTNQSGVSGRDEFYIIDVSNPANPTYVDSLSLEANTKDVVVSGNYAYLASEDNDREFQIIDVSDPSNLSLTTRYSLNIVGNSNGYNATTVAIAGNTAFIGRVTENRFYAIDISNPTAPTLISTTGISVSGVPNSFSVFNNNNYLAVANGQASAEIKIYDISNPSSISLLSSLDIPGTFNGYGVCYNESKDRLLAAGSPTAQNGQSHLIIIKPE